MGGFARITDELGAVLELTSPKTPQQNGVVERRITTMQKRAHALLVAADLTTTLHKKLWAESWSYANNMENLSAVSSREEIPYTAFTGKISKLYNFLQSFGRVCYVAHKYKIAGKWKDKSWKGIMVGYGKNHSRDTYRI